MLLERYQELLLALVWHPANLLTSGGLHYEFSGIAVEPPVEEEVDGDDLGHGACVRQDGWVLLMFSCSDCWGPPRREIESPVRVGR